MPDEVFDADEPAVTGGFCPVGGYWGKLPRKEGQVYFGFSGIWVMTSNGMVHLDDLIWSEPKIGVETKS